MNNNSTNSAKSDGTIWISEPAQIRALESPMRQEIVDALTCLGPCSITELAAHLRRAPDSLYFHIKKLVKVRLVREQEKRKNGRHESAIYAIPGSLVRIVYSAALRHSIKKVVAGAMRLSLREFQLGLGGDNATFTGPQRTLWGGRTKGWLNDEELAEVNRLIEQLTAILGRCQPGPGKRIYSLAWVFAPAQVRPRVHSAGKQREKVTAKRRPPTASQKGKGS